MNPTDLGPSASSSGGNLARAPSRASRASRASRGSAGTGLSKSQSLIKKNIELQDLKPADVLIERFVAWKAIVKQLTAYFEMADVVLNLGVGHRGHPEQHGKGDGETRGLIQVPFKSGNQFLGEGGLQNVQNDTGKLAAGVAKERELSTKLVGELANAVSMYKNTPMSLAARSDPYLANQAVSKQLQRQVLEENLLQKSIIIMQQNSAHFEEGIVRSIQSAWATFSEWHSRATQAEMAIYDSLAEHMASLTPEREWVSFAARSDHLLDPETPLRDPEFIVYPLKDDPSVVPVHTGNLERKSSFTRSYKEGYYVLTPAGFLHEFASSDPGVAGALTPSFSLFLPNCTLGPASGVGARSHKFHVEGRRDGMGTVKAGAGGGSRIKALLGGEGGSGSKAWTFRARSHEDMMECSSALGPVEAAVKSVGYASEGEDEGEYDEGSSVEEEGGEYVYTVNERYVVREEHVGGHEGEAPPGYGGHGRYAEVGPNGYAIDKKTGGGGYGYGRSPYERSPYEAEAPAPVGERAHDEGRGHGEADRNVERRASRRQMEKKPEGRIVHASGTPPPPPVVIEVVKGYALRDPGVVGQDDTGGMGLGMRIFMRGRRGGGSSGGGVLRGDGLGYLLVLF
ncbi:hypothetical protein D9611_001075 [Ephemerocybe angulata]|uniref:Uncharacterized protein n=1 Tax=Ephemerocybe angulata TaxID=980116 RepID=A0A8H5CI68_9AGAR|nr:hypothetical protein D9611_001075 [Tulosesus angulatus]